VTPDTLQVQASTESSFKYAPDAIAAAKRKWKMRDAVAKGPVLALARPSDSRPAYRLTKADSLRRTPSA
jgi:hypothetical protein